MKKNFKIQNVLSFFHAIDERIWNNKVASNQYYASLSIIIVALIGALVTGGKILNSTFNLNIEASVYSAITIVLIIVGMNIYESIIAANDIKTATLRSLLLFATLIIAFFVGVLASIVIAIIIVIVFAIWLIITILGGTFKGRKKARLKSQDIIDFMSNTDITNGEISDDGLTFYENGSGNIWKRESTSSNEWYKE